MNKKKKVLIFGGVGVVLVVIVTLIIILKPKNPVGPAATSLSTPAEEKLAEYIDEAGFSFDYPEGLTVKDVSGNQDVYSILEITSAGQSGQMTIKVVDTKYKSVNDWLKKAPEASSAGSAREVELAGMTSQQIQLENPRRLVTVAIDKGIMYYLESPLDATGEWNKAHNAIVTSFVIGQESASAAGGGGGGEDVIYEEEEIVE